MNVLKLATYALLSTAQKQEESTPDSRPQIITAVHIRHDLQPDVFTFDATHVEFKRWIRDFKKYFTSSGMAGGTVAEQQASLLNCLDPDHCNLLISKTDETRHIFETQSEEEPSCIEVLMREFDITHPLTSGPMDLFQMKQGHNEAHPVSHERKQLIAMYKNILQRYPSRLHRIITTHKPARPVMLSNITWCSRKFWNKSNLQLRSKRTTTYGHQHGAG